MKRLYAAIAIFAVIIISSLWSIISLRRATEKLERQIDRCIETYEKYPDELSVQLKEFDEVWEDYYGTISVLTGSSSVEEQAASVAKLDRLAENATADFTAELEGIKYRATVLYESQVPMFRSVF